MAGVIRSVIADRAYRAGKLAGSLWWGLLFPSVAGARLSLNRGVAPQNMKQITITADGACSPNPGKGGWAAILRYGEARKEISGSEENTTNNRMELRAIIEAFRLLREPCRVLLRTDSKTALAWIHPGSFAKPKLRAKNRISPSGPGRAT